jgi:hypothetical protein
MSISSGFFWVSTAKNSPQLLTVLPDAFSGIKYFHSCCLEGGPFQL